MRVSDMLQAHHITNVSSPGDLTLDWGKQFQPLDTLHKQVCVRTFVRLQMLLILHMCT
jgi:hypothetical protein